MDVSENCGVSPKSSISIGFSIIFTIHFRVPLFLETPKSIDVVFVIQLEFSDPFVPSWDVSASEGKRTETPSRLNRCSQKSTCQLLNSCSSTPDKYEPKDQLGPSNGRVNEPVYRMIFGSLVQNRFKKKCFATGK